MSPRVLPGLLKRIFILFNLYALFIWALPSFALREPLMAPVRSYSRFLGLWQGWDLFAPAVLKVSLRVSAQADYDDGHSEIWTFPAESERGLFAEVRAERVQKFTSRIRLDVGEPLWPDFAAAVAARMQRPGRRVVSVTLVRHWRETPPMEDALSVPEEQSYAFYRREFPAGERR